jgi:hypothetical protein
MLRESYDDFIRDFYVVRKPMSDYCFEEGWKQLLLKYPLAENYLASYYHVRHKWAMAWTGLHFTAGSVTTQRVEGIQHHMKQGFATLH